MVKANEIEGNSNEKSQKASPIVVSKVIDDYKIVINKGHADGIKKGQKYLVYGISEEVIDPITNESLGELEIVRGRGIVTHVQEKMATLKSDERSRSKIVRKRNLGLLSSFGTEIEEESDSDTELPFEDPEVLDRVKPI